ncbi:hypothetical protein D3C85_721190 [compost metagenome]
MMGLEQMLVVEHDPGPLRCRHLPPQQVGVVGATHRQLDLGRGGHGQARQQTLIRRVGHLDPCLALGGMGLTAYIERQVAVLGVLVTHAAPLLPLGQDLHLLIMLFTPCVRPFEGDAPLAATAQRIYLRLTINLRLR